MLTSANGRRWRREQGAAPRGSLKKGQRWPRSRRRGAFLRGWLARPPGGLQASTWFLRRSYSEYLARKDLCVAIARKTRICVHVLTHTRGHYSATSKHDARNVNGQSTHTTRQNTFVAIITSSSSLQRRKQPWRCKQTARSGPILMPPR